MDFYDKLIAAGLRDLIDPATTREQCEVFARGFASGCYPLLTCDDTTELAAATATLSTSQQVVVWFCWCILRTPLSLDDIRESLKKTLRDAGESDDLNDVLAIVESEGVTP